MLAPLPSLAFDLAEGEEMTVASTNSATPMENTAAKPLYAPGAIMPSVGSGNYISPLSPIQMPQKPLYPSRVGVPVTPVAQPPLQAPAVAVPAPAITPAPALTTTTVPSPVRQTAFPPVDPQVAAKAEAVLKEEAAAVLAPAKAPAPVSPPDVSKVIAAPAVISAPQPLGANPVSTPAVAQPLAATASSGFIAPAPVFAATPAAPAAVAPAPIAAAPASTPVPVVTPAPIVAPAPLAVAADVPQSPVVDKPQPFGSTKTIVTSTPHTPAVASAPVAPMPVMAATEPELSDQSRTILSHVPADLDTPHLARGNVKLDRVSPEIKEVLGAKAQEESYEAVGLSIKVRRPGLDTNFELNRAYTALMGGDAQTAIETYKNILGADPRNEEALFGLAATYHRLGEIDKARPFYGMLLKVNPDHREGLNNFLVLVSDESPQDALPELERLEARNPQFSPIPAQIAMVLDKLGYADQAREKMLRAIELAPENMTYKYNLAVMLDRQGRIGDAAALYQNLIQAVQHGAAVPASLEAMQKRLNYLVTEMTVARTSAIGEDG